MSRTSQIKIPWLSLGSVILSKDKEISLTVFRMFFKLPVFLVDVVFKKILTKYVCQPIHLLWTLHYLKSKNPIDFEIAKLLGTNLTTLRLHVYNTIHKMLQTLPEVWFPSLFVDLRCSKYLINSSISIQDSQIGIFLAHHVW
jgi:hypothetical protein